ncbi:uncharacterized protein C10orf67, mitochondrial-like isoform X2 [Narcine bancroftii]|uniref:uncharacterized protein C10orf67, mitochondrial-like isoform X2 n=1 Tax=Narcine bancroftii TaxID=1343680 RepID=UPI003831D210
MAKPNSLVERTDRDLVPLNDYPTGENCLSGAAPSDLLKIGFFKTDHATQTDVSDILELKELSIAVESLVKEITILKRSIESNILSLRADYQMKLEEQCTYLYKRMNEHNSYIKNKYLERIEVLRNSFKQQLTNAIAQINAEFTKYFSEINKKNKTSLENSDTPLNTLKQKDLIILSLKERLAECEKSGQINMINFDLNNDFEKEQLIEENQDLKEQITSLVQDAENISETIILKEMEIRELGRELAVLREKSANTDHKMQKLLQSEEYLKKALETEKQKGKQMLELQKSQMENMLHVTLLKMEESERTSKKLVESLKEKETQLFHQIEMSSKQQKVPIVKEVDNEVYAVEVQKEPEPANEDEIVEELKNLKERNREQRKIIQDFNKQLDRTNQIWEKKFAILKESYHAIKDEMYLRCSLQRQAPMLHRAFTCNAVISPGIDFQAKNSFSPHFPLPQIGSQSAPQTAQTVHKIVRAPSAPGAINLRSPDDS